jgi:hypothetical protein
VHGVYGVYDIYGVCGVYSVCVCGLYGVWCVWCVWFAWCVYVCASSAVQSTALDAHNSLKHMLPQHCKTFNDVFDW